MKSAHRESTPLWERHCAESLSGIFGSGFDLIASYVTDHRDGKDCGPKAVAFPARVADHAPVERTDHGNVCPEFEVLQSARDQ